MLIIVIVKGGPGDVRKGGRYCWKPSSSSVFSIRAFRAYPLAEVRQRAPRRACTCRLVPRGARRTLQSGARRTGRETTKKQQHHNTLPTSNTTLTCKHILSHTHAAYKNNKSGGCLVGEARLPEEGLGQETDARSDDAML